MGNHESQNWLDENDPQINTKHKQDTNLFYIKNTYIYNNRGQRKDKDNKVKIVTGRQEEREDKKKEVTA